MRLYAYAPGRRRDAPPDPGGRSDLGPVARACGPSGWVRGGSLAVLSAVFIMVSITSFGYVIARIRLETNSAWPAIGQHPSWNSVIQGSFTEATTGTGAPV